MTKETVEYTDEFGTIRGDAGFVRQWINVGNQMRDEQQKWVSDLRSIGIKAAHPDDGWVDRKTSERHDFVSFCYPQFNDGIQAGDKIAIGWPDRYRVRTVQKVIEPRPYALFSLTKYQVVK